MQEKDLPLSPPETEREVRRSAKKAQENNDPASAEKLRNKLRFLKNKNWKSQNQQK